MTDTVRDVQRLVEEVALELRELAARVERLEETLDARVDQGGGLGR